MQNNDKIRILLFSGLNKMMSLSDDHQWLLKPLGERLIGNFIMDELG